MTLTQTIARAINSDAADQDAGAALDAVRNAQKRVDDIASRRTALLQELADTEAKLGRMSDDGQAKKLVARIREIEDERLINAAKAKAAAVELDEAKADLHRVGVAGHLKTAKRNTKALLKNDEEMIAYIEGFARTFKKHFELAEKIALSLPVDVSGGMMLRPQEFMEALKVELWRIAPVHPLMRADHPPLPGAVSATLAGDPSKEKPLLDAVSQAMDFIIRTVEQGPVASAADPVVQLPVAAPSNDPDDALLQPLPTDDTGRTMDAAQIMAGIAPQKLV